MGVPLGLLVFKNQKFTKNGRETIEHKAFVGKFLQKRRLRVGQDDGQLQSTRSRGECQANIRLEKEPFTARQGS